MEDQTRHKHVRNKKINLTVLVLTGIIVLATVFFALVLFSYRSALTGQKTTGLTRLRLEWLPAVIIDGKSFVSLGKLDKNLIAMRHFYETQDYSKVGLRVDFTTEDGKKRFLIKEKELLNKLIEDRFVQKLALEQGVVFTQEDVDRDVNNKMNEYGSKDAVLEDLTAHYGWNIEDFKQEIVLPGLYREALGKKVAELTAEENKKAQDKIDVAQMKLKDGMDFAQAAQQYSEGSTAAQGGEMGWVSQEQLLPELAVAIFGAKSVERYAVVESSLGFHIVDVEEKKKDAGKDVVKIRQIFVRKKTFADWLDLEIKKHNVKVLLKGFTWDNKQNEVQFSQADMQQAEKEIFEKAQGDASLLF